MPGPRRRELKPIRSVLANMLLRGPFAKELRIARIRQAWREAAGKRVEAETLPLGLKRGTLIVAVASPVWAQELLFENDRLMREMGERLAPEPVRRITYKAMGKKEEGKT